MDINQVDSHPIKEPIAQWLPISQEESDALIVTLLTDAVFIKMAHMQPKSEDFHLTIQEVMFYKSAGFDEGPDGQR
ncbi:MAG: hypothetical protein BA861_04200 [Desulfobacterales bacterium S3730MH5]|nr:MAG: hypothetical protein BA861_04200 [Desulfobacterales bacterium S3730MH5]